jgi:uncharacterized protein YcsI (UPF0317 family)
VVSASVAGIDAASPDGVRRLIRRGRLAQRTAGVCNGYVQANMAILPRDCADDFRAFCERNPRPLPVLEVLDPGDPVPSLTAPSADLRTDLGSYDVYEHGRLVERRSNVVSLWRDDLVTFLLGCSFSFESALLGAGVRLKHHERRTGACGAYVTTVPCAEAGSFHGPLVVSMRPIQASQVERAAAVTSDLPLAHGAPWSIGDADALGIRDLAAPEFGVAEDVAADEVPVFWACGVTSQTAIAASMPDFAITHTSGYMFITDVRLDRIQGATAL